MFFDTDILIFVQRGNRKAAKIIENAEEHCISIQTYMELLQGANNKAQHRNIFNFLKEFNFQIIPFTENIGHRAAIYIEEYSISHGIRAGDAIIAATSVEHGMTLISANAKHFKPIQDLTLKIFKP